MLQIQRDLCVGCGICRNNCPQDAISIINRTAVIDIAKCNGCGICIDVCPRGAISIENGKIDSETKEDLADMARSLSQKAEAISQKLEKICRDRNTVS